MTIPALRDSARPIIASVDGVRGAVCLFCGSTPATDSARAHVELATSPTAVAAATLAAVPAASD